MVKFKDNYGAHISKDLYYLNYDKLKSVLHEHDEDEPKPFTALLSASRFSLERTDSKIDNSSLFSQLFFEEVEKVDTCFSTNMKDLEFVHADTQRLAKEYDEKKAIREKWERKAFEAALKRATTQLYSKVTKLETFRILNRTLVMKILQKHDKMTKGTGIPPLLENHMAKVNKTNFGDGQKIGTMHSQIETLYANLFCHGVLEEAQGKLRLDKSLSNPRVLLSVAFKVGIVITLMLWLLYNVMVHPQVSVIALTEGDPAMHIYAVVAALITYRWFWGFSVLMWDSADIDYILILDLDANKHMPRCENIFSESATLTILFMLNILIFDSLRIYHTTNAQETDAAGSLNKIFYWLSEHAYVLPLTLSIGTVITVTMAVFGHQSYGVFSSKLFKQVGAQQWSTICKRAPLFSPTI
jgi:hypothetical protein